MDRDLLQTLRAWKNSTTRMPLLIRGARQVGKTYLIHAFAKQYFEHTLSINFEREEKFKLAFESMIPINIVQRLYLQSGQQLIPGKSLLFLDEIQECPQALKALRYFKEELPELHVIAAGSLLEFTLNNEDMRMPVGRIESLFLKPLSFLEYLSAINLAHLRDFLHQVTVKEGVPEDVHHILLEHLRRYFMLGGLPAIIEEYIISQNLERVQSKQLSLIQSYRDDFGKYANKTKHRYMQQILKEAPGLVGEKFMYSRIDPNLRSREIKEALGYLLQANLLHKVCHTNASGLPLSVQASDKNFKVLFFDIGLMNAMSQLSPEIFLQQDLLLLNRGIQAEQFAGQELLAYQKPYIQSELYYWDRQKPNSSAEVDYVINVNDRIIPIEIKAGKTGSLRSLQLFLNEKKYSLGVRLSQRQLEKHQRILSIPLYMISEIARLVASS
ncbi:MAG: hypothetical protein A3F18_06400 [Legionellales bacterium RIFCSPHIGHO2_12_FULL_37_14]|nr:MAG: hypothetical protein A3F18_06400 [Legionellales bacterium RIFCSPHIGHO2_12_FULL_37_14]